MTVTKPRTSRSASTSTVDDSRYIAFREERDRSDFAAHQDREAQAVRRDEIASAAVAAAADWQAASAAYSDAVVAITTEYTDRLVDLVDDFHGAFTAAPSFEALTNAVMAYRTAATAAGIRLDYMAEVNLPRPPHVIVDDLLLHLAETTAAARMRASR